jgi:SAM-dependent methyltransferase
METIKRKPLQGVINIIRFNWPFYAFAVLILLMLFCYATHMFPILPVKPEIITGVQFLLLPVVISLVISWYIYDTSDLYSLNWFPIKDPGKVLVNINAGFDETSALITKRYKNAQLNVFDFYDPQKHTEASIERARNAYPPFEGTLRITTNSIPMENESADTIYLIFAAHEIRNDEERVVFFEELKRILKPNGQIVIAEHLRDLPNFIAYTVGFFHFLPSLSWTSTFSNSGFKISDHKKHTPFVNIFILEKHGNTL